MLRKQDIASICLPLLLSGMFVGCRVPNWCAYRSMRSLPLTSDVSSHSCFEQCAANSSRVAANVASVTSLGDEADSTRANEAAISAAPAIRLASQSQTPSPIQKPDAASSSKQADGPFKLPLDLPGAETSPLSLPRRDADGKPLDAATQKENILKLYAEFPALSIEAQALPEATSGQLSLQELHHLARENHPGLRAAAASVEAARGLMIQAGLPPNPNFGYEADTVRTLNTPGYHGVYLQQTFITAQKLGLAAQSAAVDYANAEVTQRKTWVTVQSSVRRYYFQVLATRKRVELARALSELSENAYKAQIKLVVAGDAAPYEPLQLRVLTTQARASLRCIALIDRIGCSHNPSVRTL